LEALGFKDFNCKPVHGGDINQTYRLSCGNENYFMKINNAKLYPGMFEKEANALKILQSKSRLVVPEVVKVGEMEETQYLVLEWLDVSEKGKNFWKHFGEGLAALHQQSEDHFGWTEDNYIGSLHQANKWSDRWSDFYTEQRVLPLVKKLHNKGHMTKEDVVRAERLCKRLDDIFPVEPPALLHGDLWNGNFTSCGKGPSIYDPASYYGHREMDLGMTLLFGGFANEFYEAYDQSWPLEKNWRSRVPLTQLYPLLVHACLFGGHYISEAGRIIRQFI
jgi:fructosamine-3-kinase